MFVNWWHRSCPTPVLHFAFLTMIRFDVLSPDMFYSDSSQSKIFLKYPTIWSAILINSTYLILLPVYAHLRFTKQSIATYNFMFFLFLGNTDIVEGNLKLILGLMWSLILRYQIGRTNFPPKKLMLSWLQAVLPDLHITNFTSDWNSGIALR